MCRNFFVKTLKTRAVFRNYCIPVLNKNFHHFWYHQTSLIGFIFIRRSVKALNFPIELYGRRLILKMEWRIIPFTTIVIRLEYKCLLLVVLNCGMYSLTTICTQSSYRHKCQIMIMWNKNVSSFNSVSAASSKYSIVALGLVCS